MKTTTIAAPEPPAGGEHAHHNHTQGRQQAVTIIPERLTPITYKAGGHLADGADMCVMEAAAYIAGEPWSDHPECVCPVIAAFMRTWNDALPTDDDRARLFGAVTDPTSLVRLVVGTRSTLAVQDRRAFMAADWSVRTFTPAWLRLAGLIDHADALAALPELVDVATCDAARKGPVAAARDAALDAARAAARDAAWAAARAAARDAARAAAGDAARDAAWAAAWAAARDAAWAAAWAAARAAAGDAAWDAAWDAARAAAGDAAWDAARDAAGDALAPTVVELQASAQALVRRMCEVTP